MIYSLEIRIIVLFCFLIRNIDLGKKDIALKAFLLTLLNNQSIAMSSIVFDSMRVISIISVLIELILMLE